MKTVLITGATDGVGRVVAKRLAAEGWRVLAHGRSVERGQSLVREIDGAGTSTPEAIARLPWLNATIKEAMRRARSAASRAKPAVRSRLRSFMYSARLISSCSVCSPAAGLP